MIDNPIYNPTGAPGEKSQAYKTAEYQTIKGMRFGIKWLEIAFKSTITLIIDAVKMAFGKR